MAFGQVGGRRPEPVVVHYRDAAVNEELVVPHRWPSARRALQWAVLVLTLASGVLTGCASSSSAAPPAVPETAVPTAAPTSTVGTSTVPSPASATAAGPVRHVFPAAGKPASYGTDHHDYPATDIFAACGSAAVSPVDGVIVHWRADDPYEAAADNPAYRGGRSAAVLGDDGVRYYLSHFESVEPGLGVGSRVDAGDRLGTVGRSGNAAAVDCHIHFGLSPDCPAREWSVRRGVIWPAPYLDDWRNARNTSPADEIRAWAAAHPTACADAAAEPTAADAG